MICYDTLANRPLAKQLVCEMTSYNQFNAMFVISRNITLLRVSGVFLGSGVKNTLVLVPYN